MIAPFIFNYSIIIINEKLLLFIRVQWELQYVAAMLFGTCLFCIVDSPGRNCLDTDCGTFSSTDYRVMDDSKYIDRVTLTYKSPLVLYMVLCYLWVFTVYVDNAKFKA